MSETQSRENKKLFSLKIEPKVTIEQFQLIAKRTILLRKELRGRKEFTQGEIIEILSLVFWTVFLAAKNITIALSLYTIADPSLFGDLAEMFYGPILGEEVVKKIFQKPDIVRYSLGLLLLKHNLPDDKEARFNDPLNVWLRHKFYAVRRVLARKSWNIDLDIEKDKEFN